MQICKLDSCRKMVHMVLPPRHRCNLSSQQLDKNRVCAAGLLKYYYKCADYDSERYFWEIDCPVDGCDYHTAPFKKEGSLTAYITHLNDDHLMRFYEIGETVLKLLDLLPTTAD